MSTPEKIPTMDEARKRVEERWEADRQEALEHAARRIVKAADGRNRAVEREANRRKRAEAERHDHEEKARKAQRGLYGRALARKIEPWTRYWLVRADESHYAISDRDAAIAAKRTLAGAFRTDLLAEGGAQVLEGPDLEGRLDQMRATRGVDLTAVTKSLAGVNPDHAQLVKLVRERQEEREREARAKADRHADERKREQEVAAFGVALSDLPDEPD